MASQIVHSRFGVGAGAVRVSSLWIMFAKDNDVFLGVRNLAGTLKLSLHGDEGSRVNQLAFTTQFWETLKPEARSQRGQRAFHRWKRDTPPKTGVKEIASIWFPGKYQLPAIDDLPKKPALLIPPAPNDLATRFGIFESLEPASDLELKVQTLGTPLACITLDDRRTMSLVAAHHPFDVTQLKETVEGKGNVTILDDADAPAVGQTRRGLSMMTWDEPTDGHPINLVEIHGMALRREK